MLQSTQQYNFGRKISIGSKCNYIQWQHYLLLSHLFEYHFKGHTHKFWIAPKCYFKRQIPIISKCHLLWCWHYQLFSYFSKCHLKACAYAGFKSLTNVVSIGKFILFQIANDSSGNKHYLPFSRLSKHHLKARTYTCFKLLSNTISIGKFLLFQKCNYKRWQHYLLLSHLFECHFKGHIHKFRIAHQMLFQ